MNAPLRDARAPLDKAREFLSAAEIELDGEWYNAATSSAVLSGINSKDAVCLKLTGRTGKAQDHNSAVPELRKAGPRAAPLAPVLARLLKLKTRSQYQTASVAKREAESAVRWATQMYDTAEQIVRS